MINYKAGKKLSLEELLPLYQSVGWTNYTDKPDMLAAALRHSLYVLAAYQEEQLVGLIRVVGDGYSSLLIQDLLVLPDYQRQGIGRELVRQTLAHFPDVYQIQLTTDATAKNQAFYQSLGFRPQSDFDCLGMIYAP